MSTTTHPVRANLTQRTDPTGTLDIRRAFVRAVRQRFRRLRGLLRTTVGYENDALGLKQSEPQPLLASAEPREAFDFETNPGRVRAFMRWVKRAIREDILEPVGPGEDLSQHWTAQFVRNAYLKGFNRATGLLFQQGIAVDNPDAAEIVGRPVQASELRALYTRTFENLNEITADMAGVIREELTRGLAEGRNPREMARTLTDEVRDIQRSRAETLARTETVNAFSQATLTRFENNGVEAVTHAEWSTAGDDRVCPFCSRLDGIVVSTDEMRSTTVRWAVSEDREPQVWRLIPPAHPNCRCTIMPMPGATLEGSVGERLRQAEGFERAEVIT